MQNFHIIQDTPDPRPATTFGFDRTEYKKQQFLNAARADVEALTSCVGPALWQYAEISTDIKYELIGCGFPKNDVWRTVANITLVTKDGKSANFTFAAYNTKKGRRYQFATDSMCLQNVNLEGNVNKVFQRLAADLLTQLS